MSRDQRRKRRARALMAELGVPYTMAARILREREQETRTVETTPSEDRPEGRS